jgi:hypothetical protein
MIEASERAVAPARRVPARLGGMCCRWLYTAVSMRGQLEQQTTMYQRGSIKGRQRQDTNTVDADKLRSAESLVARLTVSVNSARYLELVCMSRSRYFSSGDLRQRWFLCCPRRFNQRRKNQQESMMKSKAVITAFTYHRINCCSGKVLVRPK